MLTIREYKGGMKLEAEAFECGGNAFYSLLQAAMRRADGENAALLHKNWPHVWDDLCARYNAPGGVLETD